MSDVGFVIAGYGVILGGMGLYVALLVRRLRMAREALRRDVDAAPPETPR
jgi:hypothetical protein